MHTNSALRKGLQKCCQTYPVQYRQVRSLRPLQVALQLFNSFGSNEYIGEAVTLATHGLQTAFAAKQAGENSDVQIAGLLHDIGHLLALEAGKEMEMEDDNGEATGTMDHDTIGGSSWKSWVLKKAFLSSLAATSTPKGIYVQGTQDTMMP